MLEISDTAYQIKYWRSCGTGMGSLFDFNDAFVFRLVYQQKTEAFNEFHILFNAVYFILSVNNDSLALLG